MSNVNIKRAVENIRTGTTIYTPIIELVVNSIQSIDSAEEKDGEIKIIVKRSPQIEMDGSLPSIESIEVIDNGLGFTQENRDSFDTLYSDYKLKQGGKGFGRFVCLKYFKGLHVDSIYFDPPSYKRRTFSMGKDTEIIVNEKISNSEASRLQTSVHLDFVTKAGLLDKKISTIARSLVEKLLPYFIAEDYQCPKIILEEGDGSDSIVLNNYIGMSEAVIKEIYIDENEFQLGKEPNKMSFGIRIFQIFSPKNKVSKISLVANRREVTETSTQQYVPEFADEFYARKRDGDEDKERNFIVKSYVFGDYLDQNVSLERGGFDFQKEDDFLYGISQREIELRAAEITKRAMSEEVSTRAEKKRERIISYVEQEAPWHKGFAQLIDLTDFPYNPSNEEIEIHLQKEKFRREVEIRSGHWSVKG